MSRYTQYAPVLESLFDKVAGLQTCNVIKKRLQHMCFPVNIAKLLKTAISMKTCEWLFLWISESLFNVKTLTPFRTKFARQKTSVGRSLHPICFCSKGFFLSKYAEFHFTSYFVVLPYLFLIIIIFIAITLFRFMIVFLVILCSIAFSCV